jgi:hypothetical protein
MKNFFSSLSCRTIEIKMMHNYDNSRKFNDTLLEYCMIGDKIKFSFECFLFKLKTDYNFTLLTILFTIICSTDIILNMIIISSIIKNKKRKRVDLCFMSNAIADLMIGTIVMPFTTILVLFKHFPFHKNICILWHSFDFTCGTVSMLHILFVSYDRYLSVSKPLQYTNKSTLKEPLFSIVRLPTHFILTFIWALAILAWIPILIFFNLQDSDNISIDCEIKLNPYIILPHSTFVYFMPMILIIIFYACTIRIVQRKIKRRRRKSLSLKSKSSVINEEEKNKRINIHKQFLFKNQKSNSNSNSTEDAVDIDSSILLKSFFSKLNYKLSLSDCDENPPITTFLNNTLNTTEELTMSSSSFNRAINYFETIKSEDSIDNLINLIDNKIAKSSSSITSGEANEMCSKIVEKNRKLRMKFYLNNDNNNNNEYSSSNVSISQQESQKIDSEKNKNYLQVPKRVCISFSDSKEIQSNPSKIKIETDNISPIVLNRKLIRKVETTELNNLLNDDSTNYLLKHTESSNSLNNKKNNGINNNVSTYTISISCNSSGILTNSKRERYLIYKLGIILVTFIICWLPFSLFWVIDSFCKNCILQDIYYLTFWLAYLNSIFTPFILLYTNTKHTKTVFFIQKCFSCFNKRNQSNNQNS